jgi:hypothetical protein
VRRIKAKGQKIMQKVKWLFQRSRRRLSLAAAALLVWLALMAACKEPGAAETAELHLSLQSAHFTFFTDRASPAEMQAIRDTLEQRYPRIVADLGAEHMPVVRVCVWSSANAFTDEMRRNLGTVVAGASGYVNGAAEIQLLAAGNATETAAHEFAHIVSLNVNATIGNNPRWLWEAVAVYETPSFVDPAGLDSMRAGRFPTIAELDQPYGGNDLIYQVGYILGEYIVHAWGREGLVALIRANGDIVRVLGLPVAAFEAGWHAWIRARYFSAWTGGVFLQIKEAA